MFKSFFIIWWKITKGDGNNRVDIQKKWWSYLSMKKIIKDIGTDLNLINKIFLLAEALYLGYSLLFLFENTTSYSVNVDNALCIGKINKESDEKYV